MRRIRPPRPRHRRIRRRDLRQGRRRLDLPSGEGEGGAHGGSDLPGRATAGSAAGASARAAVAWICLVEKGKEGLAADPASPAAPPPDPRPSTPRSAVGALDPRLDPRPSTLAPSPGSAAATPRHRVPRATVHRLLREEEREEEGHRLTEDEERKGGRGTPCLVREDREEWWLPPVEGGEDWRRGREWLPVEGGVVERERWSENPKTPVYISPINQNWIRASLVCLLDHGLFRGRPYNVSAMENRFTVAGTLRRPPRLIGYFLWRAS